MLHDITLTDRARANTSRSSAIPAAASRRCSTSSPGSCRRRIGGVLLENREVNDPGPDRAVVFQNHSLLPWLTVYDNVRPRGGQGVRRQEVARRAPRLGDAQSRSRADGARQGQAAGGNLRRHEAARRPRPRARDGAEGAAARRAVRRARCADPRASAGRGDGDPRQARQHRADDHARRRRGGAALRPHRDDDQRPVGAASARCSTCRWRVRASGSRSPPTRPTSNAASACSNSSTSAIASSRRREVFFRRNGAAIRDRNDAVDVEGPAELGMSEPLVVIGNGMAAARFVDELSTRALGRYAVAVVGEEPRLAYNRVLLSSVLAGEVASSEIELKPHALVARPRRHAALRLPRDRDRHDMRARVTLADGAVARLLEARVRDRLAADPACDPRHGRCPASSRSATSTTSGPSGIARAPATASW